MNLNVGGKTAVGKIIRSGDVLPFLLHKETVLAGGVHWLFFSFPKKGHLKALLVLQP